MRIGRRPRALIFAAGSGLFLAASGEPLGVAPLAWVALAPLFMAVMRERRWRWSALYGLVAGVVYFGLHLTWIFLFGWMAYVGLVLVMSSWWALAGAAAGVVRRLPLAPVLVAGLFVGAEIGRDHVPWGGFGWGTPGLSQVWVPWLPGTVGATGLTFLVAFVSAWIADRWVSGAPAWGSAALVAAVLVLFVAVDVVRYAGAPEGRAVRVAVVQGNVPRPQLPVWAEQREAVFRGHEQLTESLVGREDLDVVIWGEDAVGETISDGEGRVADLARAMGTPMLVGRTMALYDEGIFYNVIDHIDRSGNMVQTYAKQHPVPFGEYVPVGALRRFVSTLDQIPLDMARGDAPLVFEVDGVRIATPICFESAFARDVRSFARQGAELMVYSTNDSSFERTAAPAQHLAHARMRAAEMRQWGVQAALSGHSAVIDPDGRVLERTDLFERAIVEATVRARPASSLYARTGDLFAWGWIAGSLLAMGLYLAMLARGRVGEGAERESDHIDAPAPTA